MFHFIFLALSSHLQKEQIQKNRKLLETTIHQTYLLKQFC